jgi:cellulose synthase/poly-beta-1,6-N-acetylglucosamine synthase-like glycosyltransferase
MAIVDYILTLILVFICVLALFLSLQIVLGAFFFRAKKVRIAPDIARPSITVLIPAHNEELVIAKTLENVLLQTTQHDSIVVVVDNCTDNTKEICEGFNVKILVREDEQNKSKGYALDYGLKDIKDVPTDSIVIVDADCLLEQNALDILAKSAIYHNRPVQGLYLIKNPVGVHCGITQKIAEFAFLIKNKIRPAGLRTLGVPCHLMGSGMAFPWDILMSANLANNNIVEDMKLGVDFVLQGKGPYYQPLAAINSYFPTDEKAIESQRTRWEHGHISTMITFSPFLVIASLRKFSLVPLLFCLDLIIPPLALLVITFILSFFISLAYWLVTNSALLLAMVCLGGFGFFAVIVFIWHQHGRHIISRREFLSIPKYIVSKLGIYGKLFGKKETRWVKTKR